MAQVFKGSEYPKVLFPPTTADSPNTTTVFDQEKEDARLAEGYSPEWRYREYPKHIKTGNVVKVVSEYDGGETFKDETVLVGSPAEEKKVLAEVERKQKAKENYEAQQAALKEAAEPVKKSPGRPKKVVEETEE